MLLQSFDREPIVCDVIEWERKVRLEKVIVSEGRWSRGWDTESQHSLQGNILSEWAWGGWRESGRWRGHFFSWAHPFHSVFLDCPSGHYLSRLQAIIPPSTIIYVAKSLHLLSLAHSTGSYKLPMTSIRGSLEFPSADNCTYRQPDTSIDTLLIPWSIPAVN